jgi:hypothetical protein
MKRIERLVRTAEKLLEEFDDLILQQAVNSIALLSWSVYDTVSAPPLDFLQNKRGKAAYADKDQPVSENEAAWNALLDNYRFAVMDSLDTALLAGIRAGYFDTAPIKASATELEKGIVASKQNNAFREAWDLFHNSFDDNKDEVLDAMHESFLSSVKQITPLNMNNTIALFKALGRHKQAMEMIDYYVTKRADEPRLFDRHNYLMFGQPSDPDVLAAFEQKQAELKQQPDPATVLQSIADTNSWNPEQIAALAELPADYYYKLFKKAKGSELRKLISASLQFARIMNAMNATEEMKEVVRKAREALTRIGKESPINARRLKPYGIEVDTPPSSTEPAT